MQAGGFGELASALCARLGIEEPPVESSRAGKLDALRLDLEGFPLWLLHAPSVHADTISIVIDCGTISTIAGRSRELDAWVALLDANFQLGTARYCRDPATGAVLLQSACDMTQISPAALHARVTDILRLACEWRASQSHALSGALSGDPS